MQAHKPQAIIYQLMALIYIQLSNWRWGWRNLVIIGMVLPLISMAGLGVFAQDSGVEALTYVVTGSIVLAILFEHQNKVASNFAFMKASGSLQYFYTLPIKHFMLVIATTISFFIMFIPALLVILFTGYWLWDIPFIFSPLLLIIIPLSILPMAGLGAIIGLSFNRIEAALAANRLLVVLMFAIGPVVIPPDRLPEWLNKLGYLNPAVYAASALRQGLLGPVTSRLFIDILVLLLVLIVTFGFISQKMRGWYDK